jgi:hypothetical protein
VRVGGLVVELAADGFSLDDGTAVGRVVLRGDALERLALIEPDDALNATGRVESAAGGAVVVVDDPERIVLAGDPTAAAASGDPDATPITAAGAALTDPSSPGPGSGAARFASLGGSLPLDAGAAGIGTLLAVSAASVTVTLIRREQSRRRLAARIAGRLTTFAGGSSGPSTDPSVDPADDPPTPRSAERGPSTIHSA